MLDHKCSRLAKRVPLSYTYNHCGTHRTQFCEPPLMTLFLVPPLLVPSSPSSLRQPFLLRLICYRQCLRQLSKLFLVMPQCCPIPAE